MEGDADYFRSVLLPLCGYDNVKLQSGAKAQGGAQARAQAGAQVGAQAEAEAGSQAWAKARPQAWAKEAAGEGVRERRYGPGFRRDDG
jgi:phage protein D